MKKAILYFAMATLFLFSCKKDHSGSNDKPAQKLYQVNFNLSGFTETISNSTNNKLKVNSLKTSAITDYLKVLYYFVFDTGGKLVHSLTQDSTAANFGAISDNLPLGTYTVVIATGQKGLSVENDAYGSTITKISDTYLYYGPSVTSPWKDTFFNKFQLTVSGTNVNQSVSGSRLVGQLEVNIEDAIPATASKMEITVTSESHQYYISTELAHSFDPYVITTPIPNAIKGTTNYKLDNILLNTYTPFTVKIVCYDASSKALGTALVTNVTCEKNKKTILSGELFGSSNTFNITLNSAWDPTPIVVPFSGSYGSQK